jgi:AraC-like DNA-binding protein
MAEIKDDLQISYTLLKKILLQRMFEPGDYPTPISGFVLHRRDVPQKPESCFNKPILAVTIQGSKRSVVGNEEYRYGEGNCLLTSVDMPTMSYLTEASPEKPYLALTLDLDRHLITQLAAQIPPSKTPDGSLKGSAVSPTDPEVLKAVLRLAEILNKPEQISLLAPIILREIHLLLLLSPQGRLLKAINTYGTQSNQVVQGIHWLRDHFQESLDVNELAKRVNMAPSTFRKHFKSVTSMSPMQYHKHLRLYEAQRLMLENDEDATSASYAVGYESLSQFNREYKRLFGDAPQKNVTQLR